MAQLKNNIKTIEPSIFLLKDAEIADRYRIYAGRIFVEFFPALGFIDNFLPKHISHEYSDAMKQKSNIITMPVVMKDEKKNSDCVDVMDTFEDWVNDMYSKANNLPKQNPAPIQPPTIHVSFSMVQCN